MKKRIFLLLICLLALAVSLCVFAACDDGGKTDGGASNEGGETVHTHTLTHHARVEAQCNKTGNIEYWSCSGCNKSFTDAQASSEATDITLEKTACSFVNGVCKWCGDKNYSEGLEYTLSDDENYYIVTGIGTCTDTNVIIPSEYNELPVKTIGEMAFLECNIPETFFIPDSVTSIEYGAFALCTNLSSIRLSCNISSIEYGMFSGCSALRSIEIPDSVTVINESAFDECVRLRNVTLGNGITTIGDEAFSYCTELIGITLPDSLTTIGVSAFSDCYKLTSITIPKNVTSIGNNAFEECVLLAEVINKSSLVLIPESAGVSNGFVTSYPLHDYKFDRAFEIHSGDSKVKNKDGYLFYSFGGKHYLISYIGTETSLVLPDGYNGENYVIWDFAFYNSVESDVDTYLDTVTSIIIPIAVTDIGEDAFAFCSGLTSITIPNSVISIGPGAFSGCSGLTNVTIPDNVETIGDDAFAWCRSLTSVTIGNSVETIGERAFASCESLTSVTIPDNVTSIGSYAFDYCTGLTSVTIGSSVKTIGDGAFTNCSKLETVNISETSQLLSIGFYAFRYCTSLASITIPSSVTTIGSYAFNDTGYYNNSENWENDVLYVGKYLIEARKTISGAYTVKEGTLYIADHVFSTCNGITSVIIPDSVKTIGEHAFFSCLSLTHVYYRGTETQWNAISKGTNWDRYYSNGNFFKINYTMTYDYTGQ